MFYILPTPIGNLEDTSLRVISILNEVDICLCEDTRNSKRLFNLLKIKSNPKFISVHSHNEKNFINSTEKSIFENSNIAYLSDAGMPCISDPGHLIVNYLINNNIKYEVIPGSNAAILTYVASGFSNSEFKFFGFLPHKQEPRLAKLSNAIHSGCISILYEAPHRVEKLLEQIVHIDPEIEIFIIKEATKLHEYKLRDKAKNIQKKLQEINIKGEWSIAINSISTLQSSAISTDDILSLNIPPKQKAKLLSKISTKSIKDWYQEISIDSPK